MKNVLAIAFGLIAFASHANTAPASAPKDTRPMLRLNVFDMSATKPRLLETSALSLSQKHQLCWSAFNMPFSLSNEVVEIFQTPAPANYAATDAKVVSLPDNKTHIISSTLQRDINGNVTRCWAFDKSDPLGKYTVTVRVNSIQYPSQVFEIVE